MQELASSLRTWRRHFARAREVDASLPDGVLLLKALESAVFQVAKEDAQAAFQISTSRQQLALDERPTEQSIWSFSQCLLAEAETLSLLKASATTSTTASTPVKLKQMDAAAGVDSPPKNGYKNGKGQATPMAEKPCRFFSSDSGCKAGKSCKWLHDLDGLPDRNSRCWLCGGKDHRKSACPSKGNNNKPASGEPGLGEAEEMGCRTTKPLSKMLPFKAKVLKLQQPRRQKKPFPVPLLRFLPWVLRVTPRELHLVQQWRWKRGELQLPMQEPRI